MPKDNDIFHDAHSLHHDLEPTPPMTNNYQRSLMLNRLPIPEIQGRGKTIVGITIVPSGQLEFCF